jgi:acyl carrier protein
VPAVVEALPQTSTNRPNRVIKPSDEEILVAVRAWLAQQLDIQPESIRESTRLSDDLSIDSLTGVELLLEVNERFGIRVRDAEARDLSTVGDVVAFIARNLDRDS